MRILFLHARSLRLSEAMPPRRSARVAAVAERESSALPPPPCHKRLAARCSGASWRAAAFAGRLAQRRSAQRAHNVCAAAQVPHSRRFSAASALRTSWRSAQQLIIKRCTRSARFAESCREAGGTLIAMPATA